MIDRTLVVAIALAVTASAGLGCKSSNSQKAGASAEAPTAGAEKDGPSAQERFAQGNERLDAGNFEGAIESYKSAVDRDPKRWDAWLNLAIAHSKAGNFSEAISAIERCLANGGEKRPEVYFNLGNIYQKRGLYRQAIKAYRTSLAYSDKPDVDTLVNLGANLAIMNRPKEARAIYKKAQQHAPQDPRINHGLAVTLHLQGDHRNSIRAFDQLLSMHPDYHRAHFDKSKPFAQMGEYQKAIDTLETYLQKAPDGRFANEANSRIEIYRSKLEQSAPQ